MNNLNGILPIEITPETVFIVNHSGGKDSQAMYLYLRDFCERGLISDNQLVVIHADLPEVDWEDIESHLNATVTHEYYVVCAGKTFFQMVDHRGKFPSPSQRQCTSDLKRAPIAKKIRQICEERGFKVVINCTGIRAEESPARAKKQVWLTNATQTNGKRTWYEWLPIHDWLIGDVFGSIAAHGQKPFWTYLAGMSRMSCVFCIMASRADLRLAAKLRPELFRRYCEKERQLGFAMLMPVKGKQIFLDEYVTDPNAPEIKESVCCC